MIAPARKKPTTGGKPQAEVSAAPAVADKA